MRSIIGSLALAICSGAGVGVFPAAISAAPAEEAASDWSTGLRSAVRLVSGGAGQDGVLRSGIEITLATGFKTYWRSPGDSGIPPRFDWSQSENVAGISVSWPVPARFGDAGNSSVGYKSGLILPVNVRAEDPARPVVLRLKLDYAVCEAICIPATGEAELALAKETTPQTQRITSFKDRVPVDAALATPAKDRPVVGDVQVVHGPEGRLSLQIDVAVPEKAGLDDVFVEGPDSWSFGDPQIRQVEPHRLVAMVEVTDRPRSATGSVPFVMTLRGGEQATQTRLDLDISPARP